MTPEQTDTKAGTRQLRRELELGARKLEGPHGGIGSDDDELWKRDREIMQRGADAIFHLLTALSTLTAELEEAKRTIAQHEACIDRITKGI